MDPRLIHHYNDELQRLRGEATEFADEYEAAASMLSLKKGRVRDPYVERLLEGVAFLAARVRLKLDAQYPVFTQQLMDLLYPGWLAPSPAACILQLHPDTADDKLLAGPVYPRGAVVRASILGAPGVRCEFETTRDVRLYPLQLASARFVGVRPERSAASFPGQAQADAESSLRLEFAVLGEGQVAQLDLDSLPLYVHQPEPEGSQLLELLAGRCVAVGVSADPAGRQGVRWLPGQAVRHIGFGADEAMFPMPARGHAGFRVLREFAALPEKFRFVEITGLAPALRGLPGGRFYLHLHLAGNHAPLEAKLRADSLRLHCVPAVNLRERALDRIEVRPGEHEYLVAGDSSDLRRFEVVQLTSVVGGGGGSERRFAPLFEAASTGRLAVDSYYTTRRERRKLTQKELRSREVRLQGVSGGDDAAGRLVKDPPPGALLYLALAERGAGPQGQDLQYLSLRALCMDREVPVVLAEQAGLARYAAVDTVPIAAIDCLAGPSEPVDYALDGFKPWLVLSHLNVNHLSLVDTPGQDGPQALRSMIELYAPEDAQAGKSHFLHQLSRSIIGVSTEQVTRRLSNRGALAFARGVQVKLTLTDRGLGGASPFLLGAVLEHYFASHVSINAFVELAMHMRHWSQPLVWNRRPGDRPSV